jgi:hypothetical protein
MQRVLIRSICLLLSVFLSAFPAASEEYFLVRVDDDRKSHETEVQLLERLELYLCAVRRFRPP